MLLKVAENIVKMGNTELHITVTDLGVFYSTLTVTIYSTAIVLRPTHGDAITSMNGENWQ